MSSESWIRSRPIEICIVVAATITLKAFLIGHVSALAERANITLVADFAPEDDNFPWPRNVSRSGCRSNARLRRTPTAQTCGSCSGCFVATASTSFSR